MFYVSAVFICMEANVMRAFFPPSPTFRFSSLHRTLLHSSSFYSCRQCRTMSFLYREAGRVLQGVEDGKASLKTLTLGRANSVGGGKGGDENGPKRKLYAMVSETLRYKPLLDRLVRKADPRGTLFSDEHVREKAQGYVMLYEMLLGKGTIQGGGKLKRHLLQYKEPLERCLAEAKLAGGLPADAANEFLLPKSARRHIFPRYARVNLLTCPEGTKGVAAALQKEGFTVKIDAVVPSLLVLPPGTDLHEHAMVKDGRLVLQDKSSCFSAEALLGEEAFAAARDAGREWKGGDVIDACAAPGNKTMHAASLLSQLAPSSALKERPKATVFGRKKKRTVFAFDKDLRRLTLMRRRVDEAGASGAIETRLQDFLEVDTSDKGYAAVGAILLDPSCSGSGIVSAPDRIHENQGVEGEGSDGGDQSRVSRLAAFQLQGLLKAMSFPQVQRICYSTCSVHAEENEDVVAKALEQQPAPPRLDPSLADSQTKAVAVATSAAPPVDVPKKADAEAAAASAEQLNAQPAPSSSVSSSSNKNLSTGGSLANPESLSKGSDGSASAKSGGGGSSGVGSGGGSAAFGSASGRFKLSRCLSRWPRRGLAVSGLGKKQAACMVRTDPFEDETNGFFVAVFERESGVRVAGVGVRGSGGGGGGGPEVEGKKKRNRHKNRKKNKKKRKREEAEGGSGGEAGQEGEPTQDLSSASKVASDGDREAAVVGVEGQPQ